MKPICQLLCCILLAGCSSGEEQTPEAQILQATLQNSPKEKNAATQDPNQKRLTPFEAVHDFFDGIGTGNVEQAKAVLVMNDQVEEYLMAGMDHIQA